MISPILRTPILVFSIFGALLTGTSSAQITVDGTAFWQATNSPVTGNFDASGSDKLVVVLTGEHGFNNDQGTVNSVTYDGVALTPVIQRDAQVNETDTLFNHIWILDNPATSTGEIVADVVTRANVTVFGLSGTTAGAGATAISENNTRSVDLATSRNDSIVIASFGMGGAANSGNTGNVTVDEPLIFVSEQNTRSWNGHVTGYAMPGFGTTTYSFTGGNESGGYVIAAEFQAPSTEVPTNPFPAFGVVVPGGQIELNWTNLAPESGDDVWVDVWFGTDANNLTQVVDADTDGPNRSAATVTADVAGNYAWRVDSYVDGSTTGEPVTGTPFFFVVEDGDADGFPDDYERLHTNPPSPTALNPGDDRDGDGITNWDEYEANTNPSLPDTDGDGLLDGADITVTSSDPRYAEWASAGILYDDNGGDRTFRSENASGTDPLNADSDGDTLPDGVESNTGTFVDASDTGTDPNDADTDADGLADNVETNTGTFINENDTGTNPHAADSDSDGVTDWYEVAAAFTDPNVSSSKPALPYPLPAPDGSAGASDKPVKVYIMSGQSNMVGFGTVSGTGEDTLENMVKVENKFPNLLDGLGEWSVRQDVRYRGVISDEADALLSPGNLGASFGPELGFGYIMGYYHDEPVLLLKSCTGNRSLGWDILPPGSPSYEYNGLLYAGYGEGPATREIGTAPDSTPGWWAGREFDRFFKDESEWARPQDEAFNVVDVLDNFATEYPEWAAQGFEIAGFVWWQGDKDRYDMGYAAKYEDNLVRLIDSLRDYYSNRYPGQVATNAPFVLATLGQTGTDDTSPEADVAIFDAQMAVDGETGNYPEYAGNVKTVYSHPLNQGGSSNGHYDKNAVTYMLVGDALGSAMVELLEADTPPTQNFDDWIGGYEVGGLSGPDDDADGDGVSNAAENYFGTDPSNFTPGLAANAVSLEGDTTFTFSHPMNDNPAPDLTAGYQWSTDLSSFHQDGATDSNNTTVDFVVGTPANGEVTVTATITGTQPDKMFIVVDVTQTP
jgi:hypothetical protein